MSNRKPNESCQQMCRLVISCGYKREFYYYFFSNMSVFLIYFLEWKFSLPTKPAIELIKANALFRFGIEYSENWKKDRQIHLSLFLHTTHRGGNI